MNGERFVVSLLLWGMRHISRLLSAWNLQVLSFFMMLNTWQVVLVIFSVLMNCIGFILMGIDKKRARNSAWRIRERTLFSIAFLCGGMGILLGMLVFRHKTKHWSFKIGVPVFILFNAFCLYFLFTML